MTWKRMILNGRILKPFVHAPNRDLTRVLSS